MTDMKNDNRDGGMQLFLNVSRMLPTALLLTLLGACGGGGNGDEGSGGSRVSISFSLSELDFQAASMYAARPQEQTIVATLAGAAPNSTLYVLIEVGNPALVSVGPVAITGSNTGSATVTPMMPSSLSPGTHNTTITVRACLDSPNCANGQIQGSPRTIPVNYTIPSNVRGDVVMPGILPAGEAGSIVIRGRGFRQTTTVSIGNTPATNVTYVNESELRASFAARPAATYDIRLDGGSTLFTGQLSIVDVPTFAAASVLYPDPSGAVYWLIHDPLRNALIVEYFPLINNAPRKLLRYQYQNGSWVQTMSTTSPAGIRQVVLAPDGSALLLLTSRQTSEPNAQNAVVEMDPVTFDIRRTTQISLDFTDSFSLSFANDGNAVISTRPPGSGGQNFTYLFAWKTNQALVRTTHYGFGDVTAGSADGSAVFVGSSAFDASTGVFRNMQGPIGSFGCFDVCGGYEISPASVDRAGNRILAGTEVGNREGMRLGQLNTNANGNLAGVINPQGTRAYVLDNTYRLHTFDLTSAPVNGQYPEIGAPIAVPSGMPLTYSRTRMDISLDGRTGFLGTYYGVRVVPLPN
jgi:hypothetical protein